MKRNTPIGINLRTYRYSLILVILSLSTFLVIQSGNLWTQERVFWGVVIIFLGAFPSLVYLGSENKAQQLPLLPLHGLFYLLTFGIPVFDFDGNWWGVSRPMLEHALMLTAFSIITMYFCYYVVGGLVLRRMRPVNLKINYANRSILVFMWLFLILHMLYQYLEFLQSISSVSHFLRAIGWISMGYIYLQVLQNRVSPFLRGVFLWGVLPLEAWSRFSHGSIAFLMLFLLFFLIINWHFYKKMPTKLIFFVLAAYIVINPVKSEYRTYVWTSGHEYGVMEKGVLFISLIKNYYLGRGRTENSIKSNVETNINRMNHISVFAYVIDKTPKSVPFWEGETYKFLLVSYIPRVLWPNKPTAPQGNEFGHRYGLVEPWNFETTFNLPWLPEFYANYGTIGVFLGMGLVGLFFRALVIFFSWPINYPLQYLIGLTITFELFFAESNLALMMGGVLSTTIVLIGTTLLVSKYLR